jgi:short-subunit dehydrogenase
MSALRCGRICSKSAVLTYGLALRSALRKSGIGVSVICPGYVVTPMMQQEAGRKPFAIPSESAPDLIVRGLERDRSIIAFSFLFALITRLGGLLPESVQRWAMPRFSVSERAVTD